MEEKKEKNGNKTQSGKRIIDPASRDYDFSEIKPDERFVQIMKEYWVVIGVFIVHCAVLIVNLYTLGADPSKYTYVMGLPLWLFLELCEFAVMIIVCFFIIDHVFMDMEVTPKGKLIKKDKK